MMTKYLRRIATAALSFLLAPLPGALPADGWTPAVEVAHESKRCVAYRARWSSPYIVIEARLEPGWHTFAMDNQVRADERLAGKKALSQDMPTQVTVTRGARVDAPWFQSPPKDFSRPELRWFSWGFEERALFAAKARPFGKAPALIAVRGQACTDSVCRRIDVTISLPAPDGAPKPDASDVDLKAMVEVRRR